MRLAVNNIGVEITRAGLGIGKLPARPQTSAAAGIGFEVTRTSRTRRINNYSPGAAASAKYHATTIGRGRSSPAFSTGHRTTSSAPTSSSIRTPATRSWTKR